MRVKLALLLVLLMAAAAVVVWRSPASYAMQDRDAVAVGVTPHHPIGTDELGRDRAVRTAAALLLGLGGACAASALASVLALALGAGAAFAPRWLGRTVLYAGDLSLTLPWLFLLLLVRSALPLTLSPLRSATLTFLLLALLGAPTFLRLNYEKIAGLRRADWLFQARAMGLRGPQVARGLLPHMRPLLLTQFLLYVPACIIAEANLGTLGLGVSEPLPSWGSMIGSLQSAALLSNSRLMYVPVALLVVVLLALELLVFEKET